VSLLVFMYNWRGVPSGRKSARLVGIGKEVSSRIFGKGGGRRNYSSLEKVPHEESVGKETAVWCVEKSAERRLHLPTRKGTIHRSDAKVRGRVYAFIFSKEKGGGQKGLPNDSLGAEGFWTNHEVTITKEKTWFS